MVWSVRAKRALLVIVALCAFFVVGHPDSVNRAPFFADHTGPSALTVRSFERIDSGCREAVGTYAGSSIGNGSYSQTTFVETGDPNADLSARVERVSPDGADLSVFHVYVESHSAANVTATTNSSCRLGVQYRIELTPSGGSPAGLLPDAHGTQIRWYENGEHAGCTGSFTSPLRSRCPGLGSEEPERTWANATSDDGRERDPNS